LDLTEQDLDRVADLATREPYAKPRPVARSGIMALLQAAFDGRAAGVVCRTASSAPSITSSATTLCGIAHNLVR